MRLDLPTLLAVTVCVMATTGVLLVFTWAQTRTLTALLWWGIGLLLGALASALFSARGLIPDLLSIDIANAILLLAYGIFWSATRTFEGRPVRPGWSGAGALLWLAACQNPAFYNSLPARVMLCSAVVGVYALAGAREIWRGREERLVSRFPTLVILLIHVVLYFARIPLSLIFPITDPNGLFQSPWVPILALEALLHAVGLAFLLMAMAKERAEREQRIAASTDELTGVANRRAFLAEGGRRLAATPAESSAALLLFDLDHFKGINDRFGHEVGDRALFVFCRAALAHLGPNPAFGRLGGEEFACLLEGTTAREAYLVAERIRMEFAEVLFSARGQRFQATVSVGVADTAHARRSLSAMLALADGALYRAKAAGRNRVEPPRPALVTAPARAA